MDFQYKFGVLTVSDTCSVDASKDTGGPKLVNLLKETFPSAYIVNVIVRDDKTEIKSALKTWISQSLHVIITTGGTGFSSRDVTPEATKEIIVREAPGISLAILLKSLEATEMAALSRLVCGISSKTLIINFPGKLKAVIECFDAIRNLIPHAVALITENKDLVDKFDHGDRNLPNNETSQKSKVKLVSSVNRVRESPYPMIKVSEALQIILDSVPKITEYEKVTVENSLGRLLCENVFSTDPLPPFRASIKDGYAINIKSVPLNTSSTNSGNYYSPSRSVTQYKFQVLNQNIYAGDNLFENFVLKPNEAIPISTGAPVPDGADAVVPIEETIPKSEDGIRETAIYISKIPSKNQNIRDIGSDLRGNELILKADTFVDIGVIGLLATAGRTSVKVYKKPSIALISTGNELQNYNEPLKPFHIRDTNKITLKMMLKKHNFDCTDCGIVKDSADALKSAFERAFTNHDVVITTGGVSMGEYDLIKDVLKIDFNAHVRFGRVNMKPGLPTTFATCVYNGKYKLIFALPGNPVSALVTGHIFVLPALRKYFNIEKVDLPTISVFFGDESYKLDQRPEYARAFVADGKAYLLGNQISSRIGSLAGATVLLKLPGATDQLKTITEGHPLDGILLD